MKAEQTGRSPAMLADGATIVVSIVALAFAATSVYKRVVTGSTEYGERIENWEQYLADGHRIGPPDAEVVLLEFGDYECPFCQNMETALERIRADFPARFAVVYRHLPLSIHEHAYPAARMAECAASQGMFGPVHRALYAAESLAQVEPASLAGTAAVPNVAEFVACSQDSDKVVSIEADLEAASSLGFRSTPTLVLNGIHLTPTPGPDEMERLVRQALR